MCFPKVPLLKTLSMFASLLFRVALCHHSHRSTATTVTDQPVYIEYNNVLVQHQQYWNFVIPYFWIVLVALRIERPLAQYSK
jgi:hypothetical protein